jgi:hypothetical protein
MSVDLWKPDKSANLGKRMFPYGAKSWLGTPVLGGFPGVSITRRECDLKLRRDHS